MALGVFGLRAQDSSGEFHHRVPKVADAVAFSVMEVSVSFRCGSFDADRLTNKGFT
jgi:hypothetical protein